MAVASPRATVSARVGRLSMCGSVRSAGSAGNLTHSELARYPFQKTSPSASSFSPGPRSKWLNGVNGRGFMPMWNSPMVSSIMATE